MKIGESALDFRADDAMALYLAALAVTAELGLQLERMGISSRADCLEDAKHLGPAVREGVEKAVEDFGAGLAIGARREAYCEQGSWTMPASHT